MLHFPSFSIQNSNLHPSPFSFLTLHFLLFIVLLLVQIFSSEGNIIEACSDENNKTVEKALLWKKNRRCETENEYSKIHQMCYCWRWCCWKDLYAYLLHKQYIPYGMITTHDVFFVLTNLVYVWLITNFLVLVFFEGLCAYSFW